MSGWIGHASPGRGYRPRRIRPARLLGRWRLPSELVGYVPRHGGLERPHLVAEAGAVVVIALVLLVGIRSLLLQPFAIPSGSMEDTLEVGDRVVVTMPDRHDVRRGDVVVFVDPDHWLSSDATDSDRQGLQDVLIMMGVLPEHTGHHLIKRVIGVGGDRVSAGDDGVVRINGVAVDEPYLRAGTVGSKRRFDVTVPEGYVWVMGDNRANSADSRYHMDDAHGGMVPLADVVGVAKAVVWPLDHAHRLEGGETVLGGKPAR